MTRLFSILVFLALSALSSISASSPAPEAKFILTGSYDCLVDDAAVEDILIRTLLLVKKGVKYDQVCSNRPRHRKDEMVVDLWTDLGNQRLGRYRMDRRAKTYRCVLTVYP